MLSLSQPKEPYWIDLPGVRFKVRPCTTAIFYLARAFMNQKLGDNDHTTEADLPNLNHNTIRDAEADYYLTLGLARAGIIEGVSETDGPLSDDKINDLFETSWFIAENFKQQYVTSREVLEAEKNALGLVSNGTSETGQPTAKTVPTKKEPARKAKKAKTTNTVPTSNTTL